MLQLKKEGKSKGLDMGCGHSKYPEAVGIDIDPSSEADIKHDLNNFPYPLDDNTFDLIICKEILEHLDNITQVMQEIHRRGKPGAKVIISTPHFSCCSSYIDPTHKHHFSVNTFDYFCNGSVYSNSLFAMERKRIIMSKYQRVLGLELLANAFCGIYERFLTFIFPAARLEFELEVKK